MEVTVPLFPLKPYDERVVDLAQGLEWTKPVEVVASKIYGMGKLYVAVTRARTQPGHAQDHRSRADQGGPEAGAAFELAGATLDEKHGCGAAAGARHVRDDDEAEVRHGVPPLRGATGRRGWVQ